MHYFSRSDPIMSDRGRRTFSDLSGLCALPGSLTWPARTHLWSHHRIQHHAPLARSAEMAHAEPGSAARTALRF